MSQILINLAYTQGRRSSARASRGHDLYPLFLDLPCEDRAVLRTRYRVFWSLYNRACYSGIPGITFDYDCEDLERKLIARRNRDYERFMFEFKTLDKLLTVSGKGYNQWRYFVLKSKSQNPLLEPEKMPKTPLDLMLELWRALTWLSALRIQEFSGVPAMSSSNEQPLDGFLNDYMMNHVYRGLEDEWSDYTQQCDNAEFRELWYWFRERPHVTDSDTPLLVSGLELFNARAGWLDSVTEASSDLEKFLMEPKRKIVTRQQTSRLFDIHLLHRRIVSEGLTWHSMSREFRHLN